MNEQAQSAQAPLLGELLLGKNLIRAEDLDNALVLQRQIGGRLGGLLIRIGALSEDSLLRVLEEQLAMPLLDADELPFDAHAVMALIKHTGIGLDWWLDQEVLAWETAAGDIRCIAHDSLDGSIAEVVRRAFPTRAIEWCLARSHDLEHALEQLAKAEKSAWSEGDNIHQLRELAEEAPVIEFVNNLLSQAFDQNASDIHVEPEARHCIVRFRVDGVLYTRFTLPAERFKAIASRIKLISGMDIAERRLPQDGRLGARVSGEELDIRVSAVPGVHGESIVMRLLPKERQDYRLDRLGLEEDHYRALRRLIEEPHGIILVTGPTGSGKSTSLYAALEALNDSKRKIITVEDPVEYQIDGITQIQVHSEIGYTFARALRAILRQDPDIVMIGEIRDQETGEIAIQASLTGHLVFATLHTNDAVSAFTRLIDMGIEPFLVGAPIRAVIAQRLVRKLCPRCAQAAMPVGAMIEQTQRAMPEGWRDKPARWRQAAGCPHCQGVGYKGRSGIYELVEMTPDLQSMIVKSASTEELAAQAKRQGCRNLREDGLLKAHQGLTSLEEVLRVTSQ